MVFKLAEWFAVYKQDEWFINWLNGFQAGRTVYKQADRLVSRTTKLNGLRCYWQLSPASCSRPSSMRESSYTELLAAYLGSFGNDSHDRRPRSCETGVKGLVLSHLRTVMYCRNGSMLTASFSLPHAAHQ